MDGAQRFGRYKVTGTLGSGAMGQVYAAVDDVLGRSVAVKTLHGGATGLGARILDERFRLEARAVAALNHPGIVQVYDIDLAAAPPYLVMERMAGPSLKERFEQGPLPAHEVRALGIQIARALAAAHSAGIVHRDVKPANILVAGPGAWKLADFGVAHVPDSSLTMTGQFVGSPAYAPPEALLRGQSTAAGDVFGLGATLYYGAAGRWPRGDATSGGLLAPVPSVQDLAPNLPEDLIATIDQAVEIEPDRRPTAAELADALAGAAPRGSKPAATQFVPDATSGGSRSRVLTPVPIETAFVADSTRGAWPGAATPAPTARPRWQPWAVGAGVLALVITLAATRSMSTPTPLAPSYPGAAPSADESPAMEPPAEEPPPPPQQIRATPPPMNDWRAAEDWNRVVEELYAQRFGRARQQLEAWERQWGESEETRSLRQQLDALPAELVTDD